MMATALARARISLGRTKRMLQRVFRLSRSRAAVDLIWDLEYKRTVRVTLL